MRARSLRVAAAAPLLALALLAAGAPRALADLPSPPTATIPPVVVLGGQSAAGADPATSFTCEFRWPNGDPLMGSVVALDFSECAGVRLCANQPSPGVVGVSCPMPMVMAITGADGRAMFQLVGSASGMPTGACPPSACVAVYADGVRFGNTQVVTPDLDGGGGLGPGDLSLWLDLLFAGGTCPLADFDGSGVMGPNDLSLWLAWSFAGGSVESCTGATCP